MEIFQGLFQFCDSHPMLESLHIDTEWIEEEPIFVNKPDWKLLHLKDFVYHCQYPEKGKSSVFFLCLKITFGKY